MKRQKNILFLLAIGSFIILCISALPKIFILSRDLVLTNDESWKKKTSPLPKATIKEICQTLLIMDDPLCTTNQDVYAPEFFSAITKKFDKSNVSYNEVQYQLGKYQTELEPLTKMSNGDTYFVSHYDLRGDGVTGISFFFFGTYEDSNLMKIRYYYGDEFGF